MTQVAIRLFFAAGHRILGLSGAGTKCRNPHGHTFHVVFTFAQTDDWPPPVEFGEAKAALRQRIKERYDHGFFVDEADESMRLFLEREGCRHHVFHGPPTTERIAKLLAREAQALVPAAQLLRVSVEEGPENTAIYEPP